MIPWLAILSIVLLGAAAHSAEMCAPNTSNAVCVIIEMRNNALDEAVAAEGARRDLLQLEMREREYWKSWVEGEEAQAKALSEYWSKFVAGLAVDPAALAARLEPVCAWHGTMNAPTAALCTWWSGVPRS